MKKGVNIFITDKKNRILVLKRDSNTNWNPGVYNLPGGKALKGETLGECVRREGKEETGLLVEPENQYFTKFYYPDNKRKNAKAVVYAFKVKYVGGKIRLNDEHTSHKWISKKSWKKLKYTPSCQDILEKLF